MTRTSYHCQCQSPWFGCGNNSTHVISSAKSWVSMKYANGSIHNGLVPACTYLCCRTIPFVRLDPHNSEYVRESSLGLMEWTIQLHVMLEVGFFRLVFSQLKLQCTESRPVPLHAICPSDVFFDMDTECLRIFFLGIDLAIGYADPLRDIGA